MRTRNLSYIVTLAEERNFSRAAERLYISQSSLSKIVSNIERDLGVPLFDRDVSPIRITPAGKIYVEAARDILLREASMEKEVKDLTQDISGSLRIGCTLPLSNSIMPRVLSKFIEMYPKVTVKLVEGKSTDRFVDLLDGNIDFMMGGNDPYIPDIETITIARARLLMISPKGYINNLREDSAIKEVADIILKGDYRYVMLPSGLPGRVVVDSFFEKYGIVPKVVSETRMPMTALLLAAAGTGITFLPSYAMMLVNEIINVDRIDIYPLPEEFGSKVNIHTVKGAYISRAMRKFIDMFKSEYLASVINYK